MGYLLWLFRKHKSGSILAQVMAYHLMKFSGSLGLTFLSNSRLNHWGCEWTESWSTNSELPQNNWPDGVTIRGQIIFLESCPGALHQQVISLHHARLKDCCLIEAKCQQPLILHYKSTFLNANTDSCFIYNQHMKVEEQKLKLTQQDQTEWNQGLVLLARSSVELF